MPGETTNPHPVPAGAYAVETHPGRNNGLILMIVGGAGILTGLITDEDVLTIAGAGVEGIGLYLYLR